MHDTCTMYSCVQNVFISPNCMQKIDLVLVEVYLKRLFLAGEMKKEAEEAALRRKLELEELERQRIKREEEERLRREEEERLRLIRCIIMSHDYKASI